MIPNFFYFAFPKVLSSVSANHVILDIIEHGSQAILFTLLIFLSTKSNISLQSKLILGMTIFLIVYYFLWILLFLGYKNLLILICMAIFPVIYFILGEMWLKNYPAIIPTLAFGIVHTLITYKDYYSN